MLKEYYNTEDSVLKLISLGDLSYLDKKLEADEGVLHSFENPADGVTVSYHRDRSEPFHMFRVKTLHDTKKFHEEYNYIFESGKWFYYPHSLITELKEV